MTIERMRKIIERHVGDRGHPLAPESLGAAMGGAKAAGLREAWP